MFLDVVDGKMKMILGMLWSLVRFSASDDGDSAKVQVELNSDVKSGKREF